MRFTQLIKQRSYHTSILRSEQLVNPSNTLSKFNESELANPTWSVIQLLETHKQSISESNNQSTPIVTEELIRKLGALCYLSIPETTDQSTNHPTNMASMRDSVQSMIGWMSTINHVDCEGIEPIYTPLQIVEEYMTVSLNEANSSSINQTNSPTINQTPDQASDQIISTRLRADQVDTATAVNILELSPHTDRGFIAVPKVVDIDE